MNNPESDGLATANQPADETDFAILGRVRQLFEETDPMPADLPGRIRFALALRDLETEMARVASDDDAPVLAVRGEEHSRTITFESDSLVVMIRVGANPDGTARLDGWLDPPAPRRVEVSTAGPPLAVLADDDGQIADAHSISAGLDYPGVGPEHAYLRDIGRAEYVGATDAEALKAFGDLARTEGIIPALEPAHALARARELDAELILVGLSGRGDKDLAEVLAVQQRGQTP
jgi:hypothetical protein